MKKISDNQIKDFFAANKPEVLPDDAFMNEARERLSDPEIYFEARLRAVRAQERRRFRRIILLVLTVGMVVAFFVYRRGGFFVEPVVVKFSLLAFLYRIRFVLIGVIALVSAVFIPSEKSRI